MEIPSRAGLAADSRDIEADLDDTPDRGCTDEVIATGKTICVREFCELALIHIGRDDEDFVAIDQRSLRDAGHDQ